MDDGSEWSIEILDGVGNITDTTKQVKQRPPATTSKEIHPFFSGDFSAKAVISDVQSAGRGIAKRSLDVSQTPHILPTERQNSTSVANGGKGNRTNLFNFAHDTESRTQPKKHEPIQPSRNASGGSSTQNSTTSKGDEEESLPIYSFMEYDDAPAVVYTTSESEANDLVLGLKGPLGFDLEWRVMWQSSAQERRTALVQLCDHDTILLIQVSRMKRFPRKVSEVIESADVVKTGANILDDGEKLFRDFGIRASGLVELGAFASWADDNFSTVYNRKIVSLAKMVAMYLRRKLLKGKVRTSNWEADLSNKMVEYAANDCYCALMVYERLQEIAFRTGKALDPSTYSCQVDPGAVALKLNYASQPMLSRNPSARTNLPPPVPEYCIPEPPRPQQLRAYKLWHVNKMPLEQMCMTLRTAGRVEPLKESTVISYVIGALQADPRLPFDMADLKTLVSMEASSWQRHRQWIASHGTAREMTMG